MALTAPAQENDRDDIVLRFPVVNAAKIYARAKAAGITFSHATAANRGQVTNFSKSAGEILLGPASPHFEPEAGGSAVSVTGDTSVDVPPTAGIVGTDTYVSENLTVDGVADDNDAFKPVYLTDEYTFTLTRPAAPVQVCGMVLKALGTDKADVLMYGLELLIALAMSGGGSQVVFLGSIDAAQAASGDVRVGIPAPFHGRIVSIYAMIGTLIASGGAGSVTYNLEINTVNVTGGVVTIADSDAVGVKKAGTAITALNVVSEGDLIDVEAVVGVANTGGRFDLFAVIEPLPGL